MGEGENRTDVCFQFTTVNKFSNFAQPLGGYVHQEEGCREVVVLCALLVRLGHGGDQFAARAKHLKRTYLRFAADEIKHCVGVLDLIFEALRVIVHNLVRTEAPNVIDIFGCRRRDAAQASVTSELNRIGSDVSCSSMDDDRLASFKPGLVEQRGLAEEPFRKSSLSAGRTHARARPSSWMEQGSVPRCP